MQSVEERVDSGQVPERRVHRPRQTDCVQLRLQGGHAVEAWQGPQAVPAAQVCPVASRK